MTAASTAHEVDDEAAVWAARIDRGSLTREQNESLESWLASDPRRQGALLKAQAALSLLERGRALSGVIPMPQRQRRLNVWRWAIASGSVVVAAMVCISVFSLIQAPRHYATEIGEVRRLPLADGSVVALNTDSVLVADIKPDYRGIRLTRGEAWFQVVRDVQRPFVVEAGRTRVQALGTAFSVRREDDGTEVLVTEGSVQIWMVGEESHKQKLSAGTRVRVADYSPATPIPAESVTLERTLAWREGQIALEGETLADAVIEFNRYNRRKLVIDDPGLAREKLVGRFRTTEPETFARAVVQALGARVAADSDTIRLSRVTKH